MDYKELDIGSKISMLRIKDSAGVRIQPKQYVSQLLDLDNINKIAKVAMPIEGQVMVPLEIGETYRIVVYTSNGLYKCMSKIIKRYKEGALYMMDIKLMGKLEKHQRRQFFRLMCDLAVEHRAETEEEVRLRDMMHKNEFKDEEEKTKCIEDYESLEFEWLPGNVVDISGGGIRFKCGAEYAPENVIVLRIPVVTDTDNYIIPIQARVIRSTRDFPLTNFGYDVRAEYINIDNRIREMIVRYIFDEQRRRIRR